MTNVKNSTNMSESQQSICDWAEGIFGPVADPRALVARAMLEMKELDEAVADRDISEIGREAADVLILLYRLADQCGRDLDGEVQGKMAINRARKWSAKGDGTGSHV